MAVMSLSITRCGAACGPSSSAGQPSRCTPGGSAASVAAPSVTTTQRSAGHWASTGASVASRSGEVTSTRTSQSCRMNTACSGLSSGLIGTITPPAAGAPKLAITVSKRFSR